MKRVLLTLIFTAAPLAQALCVSANKVTMYKGPGSQFPKSWVVGKYMPLQELERKDKWIKVKDLDGDIHWVPSTQVTYKYRCIVIKTGVAQLRAGAGAQHPAAAPMMTADRFTPFKRIDSEGPWIHVENDFGIKAWTHEKNVWKPTQMVKMGF